MEHEKNTRSKLGGVSWRGKRGRERENQRTNDTEKLQQAKRWLAMRLACCAYKTIPCFITVDCGIVLAFQQIAFFHIVF